MKALDPLPHGSTQSLSIVEQLGEQAPLISDNGRRAPDRRRVSFRWLIGSVLTGCTSLLLMGGALYAALDGRQQLAQPASILDDASISRSNTSSKVEKGDRTVQLRAIEPVTERVLQVPTVTRQGDSNVIRNRPFAYASAPLAIDPQRKLNYPRFNPLNVFSASGSDRKIVSSDVIYSADIESEVTIKQVPFNLAAAEFDTSSIISTREAQIIVRAAAQSLRDGGTAVSALPYLDTSRFELNEDDVVPTTSPTPSLDINVVAQNESKIVSIDPTAFLQTAYNEELIAITKSQSLTSSLSSMKLDPFILDQLVTALESKIGDGPLQPGTQLRIAYEKAAQSQDSAIPRRITVYKSGQHEASIVFNDSRNIVWANEPSEIEDLANNDRGGNVTRTVGNSNLPNAYDGIYRAALSQGLNKVHARRIVRTVAFDVDFRAKISATDNLEIFYSLELGEEKATEESEILFISLNLNGVKRSYYRFKADDDGSVDYYDENGKSAKKFLLRKPVPNGKFNSPFGMRRHPISRVYKLHGGVDWSAPRGTPILAAGNGVVVKAGWRGGNGRFTEIRHANGYTTSYSHQHRIARGVRPGARVRQGQIIGTVGSTGYSTGPHLHYEVKVNGKRVNPMKIRLPKGRVLKGRTLVAFKKERARIDALIEKGRGGDQTVAALN